MGAKNIILTLCAGWDASALDHLQQAEIRKPDTTLR